MVSRIKLDTFWSPTNQLKECGAIDLLYRIIARNVYAHSNWPGRSECTRLAVDILNLMSITYDLADDVSCADVYSFPTNISSTGFLGSSFISSLSIPGDSPRSLDGSGTNEVTVHLPGSNSTGEASTDRRGLIDQLLDIVEQVGASYDGSNRHHRSRQPLRRDQVNENSMNRNANVTVSVTNPRMGSSHIHSTLLNGTEHGHRDRSAENEDNPEHSSASDERINGLQYVCVYNF